MNKSRIKRYSCRICGSVNSFSKSNANVQLHWCHWCGFSGVNGQWKRYKTYAIVFQCRANYDPAKGKKTDWFAWRKFSVYPINFETRKHAENYMHNHPGLFRGLTGRKLSCSVCSNDKFPWRTKSRERNYGAN